MILDDPLPRKPDNPYDTTGWLDWLADHEPPDRAIDHLLEEEESAVAHELIRYAVDTYIRLARRANQAKDNLRRGCVTEAGRAYWEGMLECADPEPAKHPYTPGDAF